jgi:DNA-binding response OmpR family regulator
MLTAQTTREDVLRGLAGGADGYITKPFENEILMTGIRSVLGIA